MIPVQTATGLDPPVKFFIYDVAGRTLQVQADVTAPGFSLQIAEERLRALAREQHVELPMTPLLFAIKVPPRGSTVGERQVHTVADLGVAQTVRVYGSLADLEDASYCGDIPLWSKLALRTVCARVHWCDGKTPASSYRLTGIVAQSRITHRDMQRLLGVGEDCTLWMQCRDGPADAPALEVLRNAAPVRTFELAELSPELRAAWWTKIQAVDTLSVLPHHILVLVAVRDAAASPSPAYVDASAVRVRVHAASAVRNKVVNITRLTQAQLCASIQRHLPASRRTETHTAVRNGSLVAAAADDSELASLMQLQIVFDPRLGVHARVTERTVIEHVELVELEHQGASSETATHRAAKCLASFAGVGDAFPYLSRVAVEERLAEIGREYQNEVLLRRLRNEYFWPWCTVGSLSEPPTGIVLYGPPGTGKSLIFDLMCRPPAGGDPDGRTSAMGFHVIRVTGAAELLKPYSGQTQEVMRQLADEALKRPYQMCVLVLDEYEAVAEDRDLVKQDYKA